MNQIFVDSLERHANVCQGCFKTIYTLALAEARRRRIPYVVTGLSRGQLFETRLTEELWTDPLMDAARIDQMVLQARKAYHRVDDAVRRLLDTTMLEDDRLFEEVQILDFYRYTDVELDEMLAYLARRVPWVRPQDTGRSTNCLINDVGIYVHQRRRGYHNYALPYSWDVRLGHKERDAALAELDDDIDTDRVAAILGEIGYPAALDEPDELRLVAYYEASEELPETELAAYLAGRLPAYLVPAQFVRLDVLPLSRNGKVDRAALPAPDDQRHRGPAAYTAPRNAIEATLATLWAEALRLDRVGIHDDFFKLGGDSILAIQIVARAHNAGLRLAPGDLFEAPTIAGLAGRCATSGTGGRALRTAGPVRLTPAQAWYLEPLATATDHWNQVVHVRLPTAVAAADLRQALAGLVDRHDALRQGFAKGDDGWTATCADLGTAPDLWLEPSLDAALAATDLPFVLDQAPLLRVAAVGDGEAVQELVLVAHHLIVDAVSWSILLDDLAHALTGAPLPGPAASLGAWGAAIEDEAAGAARRELPYWRDALRRPAGMLPLAAASDEVAAEGKVSVRLDGETTRALLDEVPRQGRIRVQELLLAALGQTLADWTGSRSLRLWLEGHGREALGQQLDPARLVGWLTSIFPLALTLPAADDSAAVLRAVKEQLRAVPRRGIGYGVLRHAGDELARPELLAPDEPALVFNYLGDVDRLLTVGQGFRPAGPIALSRGAANRRRFALEVVAWVWQGQLVVEVAFPSAGLAAVDARGLADRLLDRVRALVAHGLQAGGAEPEASDFPLAGLDAGGLGKLAAALRRADAAGPGGRQG
jgi:non-ribosomal peptide synthase protein (TIGR01720 family)